MSLDNIPRGGAPPVSLAEFTLNQNTQDYFDISLVDGFNLPMTIHVVTYDNSQPNPDQYWCNSPECLFDINSVCPPELSQYGARSAFKSFPFINIHTVQCQCTNLVLQSFEVGI